MLPKEPLLECGTEGSCCALRFCRSVGNSTAFVERRTASGAWALVVIAGPHWPGSLVFPGSCIAFVPGAMIYFLGGSGIVLWQNIVFGSLWLLTLATYLLIVCRDPGLARRYPNEPLNNVLLSRGARWNYSDRARTWKAPNAHFNAEVSGNSRSVV